MLVNGFVGNSTIDTLHLQRLSSIEYDHNVIRNGDLESD
jgi:hypothetical protein